MRPKAAFLLGTPFFIIIHAAACGTNLNVVEETIVGSTNLNVVEETIVCRGILTSRDTDIPGY